MNFDAKKGLHHNVQPQLNNIHNRQSDKSAALQDNRSSSAVQRKQVEAMLAGTPIQRKPNNTGLPDQLRSGIESLSGHSMDDVKVHYNSDRPAQLNAHAYAQGSDIHLGPGQEKHLQHEAWHVVQQKQGRVQPTMQMKGKINVNDDKGLEKEADVMGRKAKSFSGETARPLAETFSAGTVLQPVWEQINDAVYRWDELMDGVRWYVNELGMMWYLIEDAGAIKKGKVEDYQAFEQKIKSWNDWNSISIEPHEEWKKLQTGPGMGISSSSDSWRSGHMDHELKKASKDEFNTGHHKMAKSTIEWIYGNLSEEQLTIARKVLDLPNDAGITVFKSLFSNITFGPLSGLRWDEPGQLIDANVKGPRLNRTLTPRSLEYFMLNQKIVEMGGPGHGAFDPRIKRSFTDQEFLIILKHLERAEKKHAIITKGGGLDTNLSMWRKSDFLEKPYGKGDSEVGEVDEQLISSKTVRDLKSPEHQAVHSNPRKIVAPHIPWKGHDFYEKILLEPDSEKRRESINGFILMDNLHRMIMGKKTSDGKKDQWHHNWQLIGNDVWLYTPGNEQWKVTRTEIIPLNEAAEKAQKRF